MWDCAQLPVVHGAQALYSVLCHTAPHMLSVRTIACRTKASMLTSQFQYQVQGALTYMWHLQALSV